MMAGMSLQNHVLPQRNELIQLPPGSNLFHLPGRKPFGFDPKKNVFTSVAEYQGRTVNAVAAFMAPAYLQVYRSAFERLPGAQRLPLYSYTAVGWHRGKYYVPALRVDPDIRQDLENFDMDLIRERAEERLRRYPRNRLVRHLVENCVFCYGCPAARNFVLDRWECPVPTSPTCNAQCIGCISEQPAGSGAVSSQERIDFVPTVEEIVEFTVPHIEKASRPVISFGQGCEGEPLEVADVIEESIREIRRHTREGVININTNAGRPAAVERLCRAGLDSIRVSLNSAQQSFYDRYYRPSDYSFQNVVESLKIVRQFGRWSSINYLVFPGLTDHQDEISALERLIEETRLNMIQTRNLNMDPEWYIEEMGLAGLSARSLGMRQWVDHVRKKFPWVRMGYFNPPREDMKEEHFRFA